GDPSFEHVADLDEQLAIRIADLRAIELTFGLAAEIDEHGLLADRDHGAFDHVADARALGAARLGAFALGEHRREVFFVVGHVPGGYSARPAATTSARLHLTERGLNGRVIGTAVGQR